MESQGGVASAQARPFPPPSSVGEYGGYAKWGGAREEKSDAPPARTFESSLVSLTSSLSVWKTTRPVFFFLHFVQDKSYLQKALKLRFFNVAGRLQAIRSLGPGRNVMVGSKFDRAAA